MASDVQITRESGEVNVGDRVFVSHHVPCGSCRYCLHGHETACETLHTTNFDPGGFSEYVRVPELNVMHGVYHLPPHVSFEEGTLIEPLACALRGQGLLGISPDDVVLVLGSGVSGLLHVMLAKFCSVSKIIATDVSEYRKRAAERFGADVVLDGRDDVPKLVREANGGRLADRVILCTGAPSAVEQAFRSVDRGGSVLFFAVPPPEVKVAVPLVDFWRNEVRFMTSYGAAPLDLMRALQLISEGKLKVKKLITHRFSLEEIQKAFELVASAGDCLKVVVNP